MSASVRLSIGRRVILIVAGVALVLAVGYVTAGAALTRNQMEEDFRRTTELVASALSYQVGEAVLTRNLASLPTMLRDVVAANPSARYAFICDAQGHPIASSFSESVPGDLARLSIEHATNGHQLTHLNVRSGEEEILHLTVPLRVREVGAIHLGMSWVQVDERLWRLLTHLVLSVLLGLLLTGSVAILVYRQSTRPIRALTEAALHVAEGDLSTRVKISGAEEEVAVLSQAFNRMADQIQAQVEVLGDEKRRIQAILDGMMQGVLLCEPDGHIGYHNTLAYTHWRWSEGATADWRRGLHQTPKGVAAIRAVFNGAPTQQAQVRVGERVLMLTVSAVKGEDDHLGVVALTADVTEQVEAARTLAQAEKLNVVGQLAAGVAHEVNSPLDGAIEVARVIAAGATPELARRFAKAQLSSLERIASIVRRLLAFSRRGTPQREPVAVGDLIHESLELVGYRMRARGIQAITPEVCALVIRGEALGLSQVLVNLISNAIDASEEGGEIRVEISEVVGWLTLSVCDDGPGVSPEHAHKIFTPFFTTKKVGKGTGLGLAVSARIVDEHGGELTLNEAAAGARFDVRLPWDGATLPHHKERS